MCVELIDCPACRHQVSAKARASPECGHPMLKKSTAGPDDGVQARMPAGPPVATAVSPATEAASADQSDVLKRLERLERQRLVLLFVAVLALSAAGVDLYMQQRERQATATPLWSVESGTIEATRVIFRDAAGRRRDSIRLDESGTGIAFCDADGVKRALFFTNAEGTGWNMLAPDGTQRASIGVLKDGAGIVTVTDRHQQTLISMGTQANEPFLTLFDENHKIAVLLSSLGLYLYDKDGLTKKGAFVNSRGGAVLGINDANGTPALLMGMTPLGPRLSITAENGAILFAKP